MERRWICDTVEHCRFCLSTQRSLHPVKNLSGPYQLITGYLLDSEPMSGRLVCWECGAILDRLLRFRRQARYAQNYLKKNTITITAQPTKCLSSLKSTVIRNVSIEPMTDWSITPVMITDIPGCVDGSDSFRGKQKANIKCLTLTETVFCNIEPQLDYTIIPFDNSKFPDISQLSYINPSLSQQPSETIRTINIDGHIVNMTPQVENVRTISIDGQILQITPQDISSEDQMILNMPHVISVGSQRVQKMPEVVSIGGQNFTVVSNVDGVIEDISDAMNSTEQNVEQIFRVSDTQNCDNGTALVDKVEIFDNVEESGYNDVEFIDELDENVEEFTENFEEVGDTVEEFIENAKEFGDNVKEFIDNIEELGDQREEMSQDEPPNYDFPDKALDLIGQVEEFVGSDEDVNAERVHAASSAAYVESSFKCMSCLIGLTSLPMLKEHVKSNHMQSIGPKVCSVCLSRFPNVQDLSQHMLNHRKLFRCSHKDFIARSWEAVHEHIVTKHSRKIALKSYKNAKLPVTTDDDVSKQEFAGAQIKKEVIIKPIMFKERKVKETRTKKIVTKKFETFNPTEEEMVNRKVLTNFSVARFSCEDCCLNYSSGKALADHRRRHSELIGPHMCPICKLRFATEDQLKLHTSWHYVWYRCKAAPECPYVAQNKRSMSQHIKWHAKGSENPTFKCDICKKIFHLKKCLVRHMHIHNKQVICDLCGHRVWNQTLLNIHKINKHTDESDLQYVVCESCPKRFKTKTLLMYHRNTHLKINPFCCALCSLKFHSPMRLGHHVRTVHRQKRETLSLKCSICQTHFRTKWGLEQHLRAHVEERKYKCRACPRSYLTHNALVDHELQHSSFRDYECDICNKKFATRPGVRFHQYSAHERGKKRV